LPKITNPDIPERLNHVPNLPPSLDKTPGCLRLAEPPAVFTVTAAVVGGAAASGTVQIDPAGAPQQAAPARPTA